MLAIEVEYLMGRAIATTVNERNTAEWPPHPQRLFSALVAAWAELELGQPGRAALEWLEALAPPTIVAEMDPPRRMIADHFVPVNDESVRFEKGKADFRHPLERRTRQLRYFPAVVPANPVVRFQWDTAPDAHRETLRTLVENLTYLGHSASPVRACLREEAVAPTLVPDDDGPHELRVPRPGRLARLEAAYALRQTDENAQAPAGVPIAYRAPSIPASVYSPRALVLAFGDEPRLGLDAALPVMNQLRRTVLSLLNEDIPTVLSGHDDGDTGAPATAPHLALAPLAFIGHRYADGFMKGAALVLPRMVDPSVRRRLSAALQQAQALKLGALGVLPLRVVVAAETELHALRFAGRYTAPARFWASVTPVVLDRHPKARGLTEEMIVAASLRHIGLPEPVEVRLGPVSAYPGAPPVHQHRMRSKQTDGRLLRHALIRFDQPVEGPLLIGAGRHYGLGLMRPMRQRGVRS